MNIYNCILLSDSSEKTAFLDAFFAQETVTAKVVFSSSVDEDPEELCFLYHPDIVILDVEKEHKDIVQLINGFLSVAANIRVITFTDYSRFSFDSSINHLESIQFLPRPVSYASLRDCIAQVTHELDVLRERDFSPAALTSLLNDYIPIIRQHYLSMLLRQPVAETENVLQKFETLKIDCPGPNYTVIVAEILASGHIENFEAINFLLRTNIKSAITAKGYQCYIFFDSDFKINCLVGSSEKQVCDDLETILADVKNQFDKMASLQFVAGIGRTVNPATEISHSFKDAETALALAVEIEGIVLFQNISAVQKKEITFDHMVDHILWLYAAKQTDAFQKEVADKLREIKTTQELDTLKRFVVSYIIRGVSTSSQWQTNLLDYPLIPYVLSRVYTATDLQTVESCAQEFTNLLVSFWQNYKSQEDRLVEQAVSFINENIANPSLDLELVSSRIGISKSYFCRLFHRITNQKFSNFIRVQRVEKAKVLLTQTNLKTYEISELAGFTSPKYFGAVFKQITGLTPSEYQKSVLPKVL